jgi:hypothetical protein
MVAAPIQAAYINRVHRPHFGTNIPLQDPTPNRPDLSFPCLWNEGRRLRVTDSFKRVVAGECRWRPEGLRTFTRSRPSMTTSMADELPLEHGMCS